jgi:hypothetical protein
MELSTLESEMLIDIYDADMLPEMPFEIENYNLIEKEQKKKEQEFAFYLKKLRRLGLIKYDENEAFANGGSRSTKYNNNVTSICGDKIHIDSKGIKLVERYNYDKAETPKKIIYLAK